MCPSSTHLAKQPPGCYLAHRQPASQTPIAGHLHVQAVVLLAEEYVHPAVLLMLHCLMTLAQSVYVQGSIRIRSR